MLSYCCGRRPQNYRNIFLFRRVEGVKATMLAFCCILLELVSIVLHDKALFGISLGCNSHHYPGNK